MSTESREGLLSVVETDVLMTLAEVSSLIKTSTEVIKTSVTPTNNSPSYDYSHLDNQNTQCYLSNWDDDPIQE